MSTLMIEVSDYPFRFRSQIFQKTDNVHITMKCVALNRYSEFHKTLVSYKQDSVKLVTDENSCLYHRYDMGC